MHLARLKFAVVASAAILYVMASSEMTMAAEGKAKAIPEIKAPAQNFSDAQLKAFPTASTKILEIRQKYWPQVQAAGSEDEMRKVAETAQNEMMKAIAVDGLTVEQYNEVVAAAQKDRSLIERVEKIEKRMKTSK